jgi:hypothetical protein
MTETSEANDDDVAANLVRLEAALDRIAHRSVQPSGVTPPVSAMLVDRLDNMIARLRAELGDHSAEV